MGLQEWFYEKFVVPYGYYYTLEATIVYALVLVVAVWFAYRKIIKRFEVRVDKNFVYALLPFIVLGGLARSVGDLVLKHAPTSFYKFILITPGIYFFLFFVTLATLVAAILLEKHKKILYHKTMTRLGGVLVVIALAYLAFFVKNVPGMALVAGVWSLWAIALYAVTEKMPRYLTRENYALLAAHMFDASATYTALKFHTGLFEEHVLATTLIRGFGFDPAVMFLLKLVVVWPILYYIDRDVKDLEYRTWLKIVVLILGLALGVRDTFSIGIFGTPNV